jgi:myosin heavy subunit
MKLSTLSLFVSGIASALAMSGRGRMTYYGNASDCPSDMAIPSCGLVDFDTQYYVAMNFAQYDSTLTNYANPNSAQICNTCIKVTYNGKSVIGKVIDKCPSCASGAIDVSLPLFQKLADPGLGVVEASWETASCDGLIKTSGDACSLTAHDNKQAEDAPKKVATTSKKTTSKKTTSRKTTTTTTTTTTTRKPITRKPTTTTTSSKRTTIVYVTKAKKTTSREAEIYVAPTTTKKSISSKSTTTTTTTTTTSSKKSTTTTTTTSTEEQKPTTTSSKKQYVKPTSSTTSSKKSSTTKAEKPSTKEKEVKKTTSTTSSSTTTTNVLVTAANENEFKEIYFDESATTDAADAAFTETTTDIAETETVIAKPTNADIDSEVYFAYLKQEEAYARKSIEAARKEKEAARKEREEAEQEKKEAINQLNEIKKEKEALAEEARANNNEKDAELREKEAKQSEKEALSREQNAVAREKEAIARETEAKKKESEALAKEAEILKLEKEALAQQEQNITAAVDEIDGGKPVGVVALGSAAGAAALIFGSGLALKKVSPSSYENLRRGLSITGTNVKDGIKRSLSKKETKEVEIQKEIEEATTIPSKPQKTFAGEVSIKVDEANN